MKPGNFNNTTTSKQVKNTTAEGVDRAEKKKILSRIEDMKKQQAAQASEANDAQETATSDIEYEVKAGDTLSKIAAAHNADWRDVAKYNNLENPDLIYPGQMIKIKQ